MKESILKVKLPSPHDKSIGVQKTTIRASRLPMEYVHVNKGETKVLDELQGYHSKNKHGVPEYRGLSPLFMHRPFLKEAYKAARSFHAGGGNVQSMSRKGRHGDTDMAYIPSHVADHFDRMMGHTSRNPHTRKREYFSLGSIMSGIKKAAPSVMRGISSAGKTLAPAVAQVGVPLMANYLQNKMNPQQGPAPTPGAESPSLGGAAMTSGLDALIKGLQARRGGSSWQDALGQAAQGGLSSFTSSPYMQSMSVPGGEEEGGGFMSNPYMKGAMGAAKSAYGAYNRGGSMADILGEGAMGGILGGTEDMTDPYSRAARGAVRNYQRTGDMGEAMMGGALAGTQGMDNPYARMARSGINAYRRTGDMGSALGQAGLSGAADLADQYGYGDMARGARSMGRAQRGGADWISAAGRGASSALGNRGDIYSRSARGALGAMRGGGGYEDMGMGALGGALQPYMRQQQRRYQTPTRPVEMMPSPAGLYGDMADMYA